MYTPMKFDANVLFKGSLNSFNSFISFIVSNFNKLLLNGVFEDAVFPGFCGMYLYFHKPGFFLSNLRKFSFPA